MGGTQMDVTNSKAVIGGAQLDVTNKMCGIICGVRGFCSWTETQVDEPKPM